MLLIFSCENKILCCIFTAAEYQPLLLVDTLFLTQRVYGGGWSVYCNGAAAISCFIFSNFFSRHGPMALSTVSILF